MYPIIQVQASARAAIEPLGTKSKFWYRANECWMLFKAEERGTGEDWAEKIACHLCILLGLPHVHYELAELIKEDGPYQPGVICEKCHSEKTALILGNQLLFNQDITYPSQERRRYKVREHTVSFVCEILLDLVDLPDDCWMINAPVGLETALDVFVGYVMLDAWIANQDRHHENWAALLGEQLRLAPTFDHGAAMARNLTDEERQERLITRDRNRTIEIFAQRAVSAFYHRSTDAKPLGTHDAFRIFASRAPQAARGWLERLADIRRENIEEIVAEVPESRMSGIAKQFTVELLVVNQKRLLQESGK
jgi:hypothetical protein